MPTLLDHEDYYDLPDDGQVCWLLLERKARQRADSFLASEKYNGQESVNIRRGYMRICTDLALEYNIEGVTFPAGSNPETSYENFKTDVSAVAARILARRKGDIGVSHLRLSKDARGNIRSLVSKLRAEVEKLTLPSDQRLRINEAIATLEAEVAGRRPRLGTVFASILTLSGAFGGIVSGVAAAPDAKEVLESITNELAASAVASDDGGLLLLEGQKEAPRMIEDHSSNRSPKTE